MDTEGMCGRMAIAIKGSLARASGMVRASSARQVEAHTSETGFKVASTARVSECE
jgi:hypothetical protein